MRKVLSFVLVLSLVLGSFGMAFAAPLSDIAGEDFEDAVNVLTELGVVKGYPDGTYRPDNIVTRAEMAVIVVSALGLADYATGTSSFSDMGGHWSNGYVAYATSLGVIAGYPDGTFKPDKTVSYDEAATMLVAALGYTPDSLVGTWPANYVTKAKVLGILDGIKAGAAGANRGDIATMTYQTLGEQIGKTNKDGDWVGTVGDSMLERLGAQDYDPTPAFAYDSTLAAADTPGAEFVVTGDEESVISLKELQGALVTAYANSDGEIIAIKEVVSTFYTGKLTAAGGTLAGGDEIGDYEIKTSAIPASASTETYSFVNGDDAAAEVDVAPVTSGNDYTVAVKISGNYITKIYSISEWDITVGASDVRMIDEDDLDDIADDQELFGMGFPLNNDDEVDYDEFALFGVATLEDIEEDDVVTVYDNGSGDVARVEVSKETVEGVVSRITSGDTKATVGGKTYSIDTTNGVAANFAGFSVSAGDEVIFYLTYAGKIFDVEVVDGSEDMLALVVDYELLVPTKMSEGDSQVKLFLADGTVKTFTVDDDDLTNQEVADKFVVNATKNPDRAIGATGTLDIGKVVEYSLDKDGKLNAITIQNANGSDASGTVDVTSKGTYDGFYIASDATIFATDDTSSTMIVANDGTEIAGTDDDDWGVTTLTKILGTDNVNAFYFVGASSKKIEWMVIEGGTTDDEIFAMYNDYSVVDTDAGYEVHVLVDGVATDYEAATSAKASNPGAAGAAVLYELVLGTDGYVSSWTPVVDGGGGGDYDVVSGLTPVSSNTVKNSVFNDGANDYSLSSSVVVYTWNSDDSEWEKGSTSALRNGTDFSSIELIDVDGDLIYDYAIVN